MTDAIRWGAIAAHPILMIPGPTELPWPVREAMSQPAVIQYDQSFYVLPTPSALEVALRDLGHRTEAGAGVAAAQAVFAGASA